MWYQCFSWLTVVCLPDILLSRVLFAEKMQFVGYVFCPHTVHTEVKHQLIHYLYLRRHSCVFHHHIIASLIETAEARWNKFNWGKHGHYDKAGAMCKLLSVRHTSTGKLQHICPSVRDRALWIAGYAGNQDTGDEIRWKWVSQAVMGTQSDPSDRVKRGHMKTEMKMSGHGHRRTGWVSSETRQKCET